LNTPHALTMDHLSIEQRISAGLKHAHIMVVAHVQGRLRILCLRGANNAESLKRVCYRLLRIFSSPNNRLYLRYELKRAAGSNMAFFS
jgi:hypothetical protein